MTKQPACTLCRQAIHGPEEDSFCLGCRAHICLLCDKHTPSETPHEPAEHRETPDQDEIDWDFVLE